MYDAKNAGRDRVGLAPAVPRVRRSDRKRGWADRVEHALEHDGFALYCQPIIDLETGRPSQYELLIRMESPDGTLTLPSKFLHAAERFGAARRIDEWVVRNAIGLLSGLESFEATPLSINVSAGSLTDPEFLVTIDKEVTRSGVDPARLVFEVAESAVISDMEQARQFARGLHTLGCQFALDDYGAGFGSFYYLRHLAVDYLKIDGEFVRRAGDSEADRRLIKALIDVAKGMDKRTIAECVSDPESVGLLRSYGVDCAQGFLFGEPRPVGELINA
jgi:EAL domain-containing protein (putative c-di-GMP-specific phosphodiesterase class I)